MHDPDTILDLLHEWGVTLVTRQGWQAIEAAETLAGLARGAPQVKIAERALLLAAARTPADIEGDRKVDGAAAPVSFVPTPPPAASGTT